MADTRELILTRLLEVAGEVVGGTTILVGVDRNNVDITEDQLPAVIVFDGDEVVIDNAQNRQSNSPVMVEMTPEIVIAEKSAGQVGPSLNLLRQQLVKSVLLDVELNGHVAKSSPRGNGAIRYIGCQTDVGWMRSLHGALRAQFMFKYTLKPDEL